eukprot:PRCOL_00006921-RA
MCLPAGAGAPRAVAVRGPGEAAAGAQCVAGGVGERRRAAVSAAELRARDGVAGAGAWVCVHGEVYDVAPLVPRHPGGAALLRRHLGTDATRAMEERGHSANAYRMLKQYHVGTLVPRPQRSSRNEGGADARQCPGDGAGGAGRSGGGAGGMGGSESSARGGSEPAGHWEIGEATSARLGIDPHRALVWQVGALGDKYSAWVHTPEDVASPRFFVSGWAEALTKTHWWAVPLAWVPVCALTALRAAAIAVAAAASRASETGAEEGIARVASMFTTAVWGAAAPRRAVLACVVFPFGLGALVLWPLLEYAVHRFVFHARTCSWAGNTMHFLLHGCHHKHPMDPLRLVFPPAAAALPVLGLLGVAVLLGERTGSPSARAALLAAHAGTVAGYVAESVPVAASSAKGDRMRACVAPPATNDRTK